MGGTVAGGLKARDTNYRLHGRDFYKRMGAIGGRLGHGGGFAANQALARVAGGKGGRRSRRGLRIIEELPDGRIRYQIKATGEEIILRHEDKFRMNEYLEKKEEQ